TLSNSLAEAKDNGGGVFDFTESSAANLLRDKLQHLTFGKDGEVKIMRLMVDVVSKTVSLDVDLKNRYKVSKNDIVALLKKKYDEKPTTIAFNQAKGACQKSSEECRKTVVRVAVPALCISVNKLRVPELNPIPEKVAIFLASVDGPHVSA